jgi:transposase
MMGTQNNQPSLFSCQINLDKRVRADNPLRRINEVVDFAFVRDEVAALYGYNGNVSVDPAVILKMMFLLFFDNVPSERELMRIIPERLDYLWFLGYELDDVIPDHSVLSKARARWGGAAFEKFFVRTVGQCVAAGLVDGNKIHVDSSLNDANASCDSVVKASPELIAALKAAYQAVESKLEDASTSDSYEAVNDRVASTTDPDAAVVRRAQQPPRPRYQNHRVIDDAHGVITAVETAVADHKYGTAENFIACQQRDIRIHLGDMRAKQHHARSRGIFPDSAFAYEPATNTYRCPAGHTMKPRRLHPQKRTWEYYLPAGVCAACPLRPQCTRAVVYGRTIHRHEHQDLLDQAREQAHSPAARRDRKRRQHLAEVSFADAANHHGFKRARWCRLWRVQIQDWLIAAIQNIKILLKNIRQPVVAVAAAANLVALNRVIAIGRARSSHSRLVWDRLGARASFPSN